MALEAEIGGIARCCPKVRPQLVVSGSKNFLESLPGRLGLSLPGNDMGRLNLELAAQAQQQRPSTQWRDVLEEGGMLADLLIK